MRGFFDQIFLTLFNALLSCSIIYIIITVTWSKGADHVELPCMDHQIKRESKRLVCSDDLRLATRGSSNVIKIISLYTLFHSKVLITKQTLFNAYYVIWWYGIGKPQRGDPEYRITLYNFDSIKKGNWWVYINISCSIDGTYWSYAKIMCNL